MDKITDAKTVDSNHPVMYKLSELTVANIMMLISNHTTIGSGEFVCGKQILSCKYTSHLIN